MKWTFRLFATLALLSTAIPSSARAESAWWQLCDNCRTDSHFNQAAFNAPQPHTVVYVTNRSSNETRKFSRFTTIEDFSDGYVHMIHVLPETMSALETSVFTDAVEKAAQIRVEFDRHRLPGAGHGQTVLDDLTGGRTTRTYDTALTELLAAYTVSRVTVGRQIGATIAGTGGSYAYTDSIRITPLVVVINYPDGSKMTFTQMPDGTLVNFFAQDIEGNEIVIQGSVPGNLVVDENLLAGEYVFQGSNTFRVLRFIQSFENSLVISCHMEDRPGGDGIRVVCGRR